FGRLTLPDTCRTLPSWSRRAPERRDASLFSLSPPLIERVSRRDPEFGRDRSDFPAVPELRSAWSCREKMQQPASRSGHFWSRQRACVKLEPLILALAIPSILF